MSGKPLTFLDTNVLVYAAVADAPVKHGVARSLVQRGFREGCFVISTQVLLELYVTLTRKIAVRLSHDEAFDYLRSLAEWPVVEVDADLVLAAVALSHRVRISPWDAAILEAARAAGCARVLSEDLATGRSYEGITVENPFVQG